MNSIVNTIASSVLSKDFEDWSADELQKLAEDHPYSGALQLLYSQKLKETNNSDFQKLWQKTLLYFNNPLFVQFVTDDAPNEKKPGLIKETNSSELKTEVVKITQPEKAKLIFHPEAVTTQPVYDFKKVEAIKFEETSDTDENILPIPGLKIEPIDPAKAALSFTPYHTIDYFASQGIKLGEEIKSADKFGSQLKSFTSWLKEMRRLPEAEVVSKFTKFEQNKVEKMAENSLTGENAITEAMAQVWIKQNEPRKAIDIYKKLSLQNPAKSAFFAAKIDHLKKQI